MCVCVSECVQQVQTEKVKVKTPKRRKGRGGGVVVKHQLGQVRERHRERLEGGRLGGVLYPQFPTSAPIL